MSATMVPAGRPQEAIPENGARKIAFLAYPEMVNTDVIQEVLARRGVGCLTLERVRRPGLPVLDTLREGIERADFVLGVVGSAQSNDQVFFDLGFASGLGKRVVVVSERPVELPVTLAEAVTLHASPQNGPAIDFAVQQFLAAPTREGPPAPAAIPETKPLGAATDDFLRRLEVAEQPVGVATLEAVVLEALERTGVKNRSSVLRTTDAATLAAWSDDWGPWVRNPLLIEVRSCLPAGSELEPLRRQLTSFLESRGNPWLCLICANVAAGASLEVFRDSRILPLEAREFFRALRDISPGELILRLQKARTHGEG